jgi:drug/metabolite transporter (DMT)-like permease
MRMKLLAGCGFLLNTIFFATYYSVTKEALNRIDPIVFTFFEMVSLAPLALVIILCSWKYMTRAVVKRGILLGSMLCLALFTIAIALKYTTATSTGFFPALNGFLAAIIAWALFREPTKGQTWLAGAISLTGAALLIFSSSMGNLRGTLIAFLGGLFYTGYIFLCDHEQKDEKAAWPLFGIELLTTAIWASFVALLFGDWQAVHPILPKDIWVVLYISIACTFIPTLITVLLQKYISPVTVSFIYILEPILGALIASLYLREVLPIQGYVGGGLVVLGALINAWGTIGQPAEKRVLVRAPGRSTRGVRGSWVSTILYPGMSCILGATLLCYLGGFPPPAWSEVSHIWPQISQDMQQGQGTYVTLLLVQAGGWLIAWISVLLMGWLALYHLLQRLFQPAQPQEEVRPVALLKAGRPAPPASPVRVVERPVLQPTRRVRTTVRLPEQYAPSGRSTQMTARLPERQAQRVQPAKLLPKQSTWYGEAVKSVNAGLASGKGREILSTEPLQHEVVQPLKRRASLAQQRAVGTPSLESLDA